MRCNSCKNKPLAGTPGRCVNPGCGNATADSTVKLCTICARQLCKCECCQTFVKCSFLPRRGR
jgi:hypothetical protein